LNGEKNNVSRTICIIVLRVLIWLWLGTNSILFIRARAPSGQPRTRSSHRYKQDQLCPQPYSYQHPEDEDRDGLPNDVFFFTTQPLGPTDSRRELCYTPSLGKHQILYCGCLWSAYRHTVSRRRHIANSRRNAVRSMLQQQQAGRKLAKLNRTSDVAQLKCFGVIRTTPAEMGHLLT